MPKPGSEGHGKSGHLSDRLRQKAPRRYFTFTFSTCIQSAMFLFLFDAVWKHVRFELMFESQSTEKNESTAIMPLFS